MKGSNCWIPPNNKISQEYLEEIIKLAERKVVVLWDQKETIVSFKLKNGFTVTGRSACVDPANFDKEIGIDVATKNAIDQLWTLEGYLLQYKLFGENH